jgi:hypothetical protein
MPYEKTSKINRLVSQWPRGTPAAASYLNTKGFSHDLLTQYKKSGWIQSFGRGAYVLSGDRVEWPGAVYALQKQLGLNVHPGGKTALELKGYGHYLPSGKRTIFLYATQGLVLPAWFKGERKEKEFTVKVSAAERAAMEMLHLVPGRVGFDEALRIMESLATLRSEMVQEMLCACRSIKVKRLFLAMAERHGHPWVSELDLSLVDLGKGKRMIVPGGRYDKKYQITVPLDSYEEAVE